MLGGVKVNDQRRLFEMVWDAKHAGAAGIAIGRNIFQADDPSGVVKALDAILHQNANVDEAFVIYDQTHLLTLMSLGLFLGASESERGHSWY